MLEHVLIAIILVPYHTENKDQQGLTLKISHHHPMMLTTIVS